MTNDAETTLENEPPTWWSETKDRIHEILARNSKLLTGFIAAFILFTGYTLVENPSRWYVPLLVLGIALVVFLAVAEARSFVKMIGAVIITSLASTLAFLLSSFIDPYTASPLLWFSSYWFVFFASIASSYMIVRGRSRWGTIMLAEFLGFVAGYMALFGFVSVLVAAAATTIVGVGSFVVMYNLSRKSNYRSTRMPLNIAPEDTSDQILHAADETDWLARSFVDTKKQEAHYLVWNDVAYLLVPVYMDQPFSIVGNRWSTGLGYNGKSVNPWLVDLIYNKTPFWIARGAPIMVVLLDLKNKNGGTPRTIEVSLPDTRHKAPVGVFPAKDLLEVRSRSLSIIDRIDSTFSTYNRRLTEKQKNALVGITAKSHNSANYGNPELSDDEDIDDDTNESTEKTA